jgi:hypothetical protein
MPVGKRRACACGSDGGVSPPLCVGCCARCRHTRFVATADPSARPPRYDGSRRPTTSPSHSKSPGRQSTTDTPLGSTVGLIACGIRHLAAGLYFMSIRFADVVGAGGAGVGVGAGEGSSVEPVAPMTLRVRALSPPPPTTPHTTTHTTHHHTHTPHTHHTHRSPVSCTIARCPRP